MCVCVCVLTGISRALGDGQVGAGAPCPPLVIPLTAAAVGPSGVVFTLAAQLLFVFVIHTAVGMKVALAPVKEGRKEGGRGEGGGELKEDNHINMREFSGTE